MNVLTVKKGPRLLHVLCPAGLSFGPQTNQWGAVRFIGIPKSGGMGCPADSQKLYWQLSQDICRTLPSKRKINTRLVTFLPFFSTFFPFLMFVHWKCPFHVQKTVPHMALHGAQQFSGSFQGSCALFPSGKSFSLCSWWLCLGQADCCPSSHEEVTWWPQSSYSTDSVLA